ncbi:MAG TPA: hypothetical protein VK447_03105, partial [Myxococcaceae bacterium]|nr:hypothetical protein [Myxococcaceae bacterium]
TATMGLTLGLNPVPQDVIATPVGSFLNPEVQSRMQALNAYTEMNVPKGIYTPEANLARYADKTVHVFSPEQGIVFDSMTAKELSVAKDVNFFGPGAVPFGDKTAVQLALNLDAPRAPAPAPAAPAGALGRVSGVLNAAGLAAAANDLQTMPNDLRSAAANLQAGNHSKAVADVASAARTGLDFTGAVANVAQTLANTPGLAAAARTAERAIPGVNVGIAIADSARFANTLADPNATLGTKLGDGITALGSIVAASQVPVASQIGAGVAAVSDLVTHNLNDIISALGLE